AGKLYQVKKKRREMEKISTVFVRSMTEGGWTGWTQLLQHQDSMCPEAVQGHLGVRPSASRAAEIVITECMKVMVKTGRGSKAEGKIVKQEVLSALGIADAE
ncbi:unnamed protein product, partial [Prorocentrum cordatum]